MFELRQPDPLTYGLALEWLEITLTLRERPFLMLVEPGWSATTRLAGLERWLPRLRPSAVEVLHNLVEDREARWRRT